jgi:hypothetical protein
MAGRSLAERQATHQRPGQGHGAQSNEKGPRPSRCSGTKRARHQVTNAPAWTSTGARGQHALFDDLVRSQEQRLGNREAERLGGLEVDDKLELGGLLHRKIRGLGAFEDFVHEGGGSNEHV